MNRKMFNEMTQQEFDTEFDTEMDKELKLNMPWVIRLLIMFVSSILIGLIWVFIIPYSLLFGMWFSYPLHGFDFIMQPYYWFEMAKTNKRL